MVFIKLLLIIKKKKNWYHKILNNNSISLYYKSVAVILKCRSDAIKYGWVTGCQTLNILKI